MIASGARAPPLALLMVIASACHGQFDFDTALLDGGEPPITVADGGSDSASAADSLFDLPRPGVRIACGASDCSSPGCCTGTAGSSCVDIAAGGTCSGLLIQCDDTDDCPASQVCCAEGNAAALSSCSGASDCPRNERPTRVHCEPESHCRAMSFVILCNPNRPTPCAQCIATTLTGLPPGYHQCAP
jgi:hypothetical protein